MMMYDKANLKFTAVTYLFVFCFEIGRKEGNEGGRKGGRKEEGKEGRKEESSRVPVDKACL